MLKLGNFILQHWNNGQWRITDQNRQQFIILEHINELFEPIFGERANKYPEDFVRFFHKIMQQDVDQLLADQESAAILALNQKLTKINNFIPNQNDYQKLSSEIEGWIVGYNAYYNSAISIHQVFDTLLPLFLENRIY